MADECSQDVTTLLQNWRRGEESVLQELIPLVYDELHRLAHRYMMRERSDGTLQTSALVNEAYIRLIDARHIPWQDRAHFFAVSAKLMRRILVEFARRRAYQKRGGGMPRVALEDAAVASPDRSEDVVALDDALNALAEFDPRKAKVVELRFFAGLTPLETAEVLDLSPRTVFRNWRLARSWLMRELRTGTRA
jgi:RNA polymerase sigma factor (TIGR02999 family)